MGEILPDGTIQGYSAYCPKCRATIKTNMQGDCIDDHVCPITVGTDFSGIGAPEEALKELGIPHVVEFACDKDKHARESYLQTHKTKIMYEDVTTRDNDSAPYVDLYCFGFPCQAFSISGKRQGFDDIRGTLFFNSADYIRKKRPAVFIAENVKGLLSHDKPKGSKSAHGRTFSTIINVLAKTVNGQILLPMYEDNLGYNVFYTVLNSKHYDVPQNRERIFIVGFREDVTFKFPSSKTVSKKLSDILETKVDEKYYLSEKMLECLLNHTKTQSLKKNSFKSNFRTPDDITGAIKSNYHKMTGDMDYIEEPVCVRMVGRNPENPSARVAGLETQQVLEINSQGLSNTLTSVQKDNLIVEPIVKQINISKESGGQQPYQQNRVYDTDGLSPALLSEMSSGTHAIATEKRIRRLTPLECFRLQGFSDEFFHKIKKMSDTQLYRQAGNSITVKVFKAILKNIYCK